MPNDVVADEHKWQKAKDIVRREYGRTEDDGDRYWRLVMAVYKRAGGTMKKSEEPLLLLDLIKGKGNRDGLIQQIVTYVRDGRTVTRKQWVRSEFADHAKKNEEEKKKTLLNEQQRANKKHERQVQENNDKQMTKDERSRKKVEKELEKEDPIRHGRAHKFTKEQMQQYKKKLEEEAAAKKDKKDGKKHTRYGQEDQTKQDNKQEQKMMLSPQNDSKNTSDDKNSKKTKGVH